MVCKKDSQDLSYSVCHGQPLKAFMHLQYETHFGRAALGVIKESDGLFWRKNASPTLGRQGHIRNVSKEAALATIVVLLCSVIHAFH